MKMGCVPDGLKKKAFVIYHDGNLRREVAFCAMLNHFVANDYTGHSMAYKLLMYSPEGFNKSTSLQKSDKLSLS